MCIILFTFFLMESRDRTSLPKEVFVKGILLNIPSFLCAEGLSAMIRDAESRGDLHGIKISRRAPPITHLFFADDSLLFSKASTQGGDIISQILRDYEQVKKSTWTSQSSLSVEMLKKKKKIQIQN